MKKILIYLFIPALLFSCADKLDLTPRSEIQLTDLTSKDVPSLLNGIYAGLRNGNTSYWYLSFLSEDLSADNLVYRATFFQHGEIENNAILANNVLVQRYWNAPYAIIQRVNDLLDVLEQSTVIPEEDKKLYAAEARAIRGYAYYRLVTLFGGVPVIENRDPDKQLIPRETEDKVWEYIIDDLKAGLDASPYSKTGVGVFKFSAEAAKTLLSRVYLIRGNNAEAKRLAGEIVASSTFALDPVSSYNGIWSVSTPSKEVIFAIQNTDTDGESAHGYFLRHATMPGGGRAELPVDTNLVQAYEKNDVRLSVITYVPDKAYNKAFHYYCFKYQDPGNYTNKFYVARLAEAYLIYAEAAYKLDPTDATVLERMNELRTKRGASALTSVDLYDIIHERRLELAFEGTRWTDMKRTPSQTDPTKSMAQVFVEAKKRGVNDLLYPVPTSARDVNPELKQNPGY